MLQNPSDAKFCPFGRMSIHTFDPQQNSFTILPNAGFNLCTEIKQENGKLIEKETIATYCLRQHCALYRKSFLGKGHCCFVKQSYILPQIIAFVSFIFSLSSLVYIIIRVSHA